MSGSSFTACAVFAAALRVADAGEMVFFAFDDHATPWMEGTVAVLLNISILVIVMCVLILWAAARKPAS